MFLTVPFKTDPHPYRMALGTHNQQWAPDAKLFIRVCREEKLPYNRHLGDQKQWWHWLKDGVGAEQLQVQQQIQE